MTKLLLEIDSANDSIVKSKIEEFLNKKISKNGAFSYRWIKDDQREVAAEDLKWGDRSYYSSHRLSANKITMDDTRYTNPGLTRFECCICLKIKPVSKLLVDYLGRCIDCQHK